MKKGKYLFLGLLGLTLLIGLGIRGFMKYYYPFGHRPATLLCMDQALRDYADDHNGFFPYSDKGALNALQKLYPKYAQANLLAGITGDQSNIKRRLDSGEPLDSSMTSWVYFQGLNMNDNQNLVILYESHKGILPNGRRSSKPIFTVLLNSPASVEFIPDNEWDRFLSHQASLRKKVIESRR
jgi:hypothetical protein